MLNSVEHENKFYLGPSSRDAAQLLNNMKGKGPHCFLENCCPTHSIIIYKSAIKIKTHIYYLIDEKCDLNVHLLLFFSHFP